MIRKISCILFGLAIVFCLSFAMSLPATAAIGSTWYVDPSGTNDGSHGTGGGSDAFQTIQYAIDTAASGDTINVAAGTYTEQLLIQKSLTITGADEATTIIKAPVTRTGSMIIGSYTYDYIVCAAPVSGNVDVHIEGFTIEADGRNKTAGTSYFVGALFRTVVGANSGLFSCTIQGFPATPEYECYGIQVVGGSSLSIYDNTISSYTRDGIYVSGSAVAVTNNNLTGSAVPLQGISLIDGATGSITGNTVSGHSRSTPWAACGILVDNADGITISGNIVTTTFYGIFIADADSCIISGNTLTDNIKRAISLDTANNNTIASNTINGPASGTDDTAIGLDNNCAGNIIGGVTPIDGNNITMATSGTGNLYAIYMQASVGANDNTISNNAITGGQRAVQFDGPPGITGSTTISNNIFSGQAWGGITAYNNGSLIITNNTLTNTTRPMEFFGPVNVTITGNTINGAAFDGINMGNVSGTKLISENTISNIPLNCFAIHGRSDADNLVIDGNTISASHAGIWIDPGCTGVTITDNTIFDNSYSGISAYDALTTVTGNSINNCWRGIEMAAALTAHNNSFTNNAYGSVIFYTNDAHDVTNNWWGDAASPSDKITTNGYAVDYSPWWGANYVGDSHATPWTWHTNDSIQEAIDAATAGDTIVVEDGTYNYAGEGSPASGGLIKVTKALTIRAADGVRPVIDGTDFDGVFKIHPSALNPGDTVIIEGFEITGNSTTDIAITMQGCFDVTPARVIIRNNWFHGMNAGIDFWGASAYLPSGWTSAVAGVEISDNKFYNLGQDGVSQGFGIMLEDLASWTTLGNAFAAVVEHNEFYNIYDGSGTDFGAGVVLPRANDSWEAANAIITGSDFSNISIGIAILDGDITYTYINNNSFDMPSIYAVMVSGVDNGPVNAVNNWWGSANGPAHADNPFNTGSQGSAASGSINFVPWLNAAPPTGVSFAPVTNGANGYASIQAAVDAASAGNTIDIAAGTYNEQVVIGKALTLQGAGNTTIIKPSQTTIDNIATLYARYSGGADDTAAVIVVNDVYTSGSSVILKNIKVDLSLVTALPSGAARLDNVFYGNSNGTIDGVTIVGLNEPSLAEANDGIRCVGFNGTAVSVEIKLCNISEYNKNGITCNEPNLTADIHDNIVTGLGSIYWIAQNGIQIGYGAAGTISNNTVYNNVYSDPLDWWSTGIVIVESNNVTVSGNTVTHNNAGIYIQQSSNCTISSNTITNTTGDKAGIMVSDRDTTPAATGNTISGNTISGGWAGIWSSYCSGNTYSDNNISACTGNGIYFWDTDGNTLSGNTITNVHDGGGTGWGIALDGGDTIGTIGSDGNILTGNTINSSDVGIWIGNGSDNNTVESNTITGNLTGIEIGTYNTAGEPTGVEIHFNDIVGNTNYGVNNTTATMADATNNWWGDGSGPSGAGTGTGDAVSANVDYDPWLGAQTVYTQTETVTNDTVDAIAEANLEVLIDGTATVTIAEYNDNPGNGSFTGDLGKYVDVYIGDTSNVNEIEVRLYYTNADLNGHIESMLTMNWWNGSEWVACSNTGVNTADIAGPPAYSGYIWAIINDTTTPSLADLSGTAFGGGGFVFPQPTYIPPVTTSIPPVTTTAPPATTAPSTKTSTPPATTTSVPPTTTATGTPSTTPGTPTPTAPATTSPAPSTTKPTTPATTTQITSTPGTTTSGATDEIPVIDWIIGGSILGGVLVILAVVLFVRRK